MEPRNSAIHANLGFNTLFLSVQILGGLISYAIFVGCDPLLDGRITAYDQIFPHLVMHLFQNIPVLRGIFLSTIFAAALSRALSLQLMRSHANPPFEEVVDAIQRLRKNKETKEDGIPTEIFRPSIATLACWIHEVLEQTSRSELVPDD
ncbi:unnamed protein product [Dibothriocephalus latus]|uniref:Uncharacterized protein n=1 Tax=Dibothriocephalus latus TaxID=60516 RepID=A0A3P7LEF8_DIBLA|nr:unnamed protein product [Dibothriocephalus latus]